ncbi:unnamed protein product [Arctia plantaginis]|uniref:Uncharacterized protein n=1 Tax=Arctia plantaginis TaxID=874455 RepID=A0A8S0YVH1_ARCPL|nr:unnamed protein product [Arctia plantaginis]
MLPYSSGLIVDKANNYGIVKTETVFGFSPTSHGNYMNDSFNSTESLEWIITRGNFAPRSLQEVNKEEVGRYLQDQPKTLTKHSKKKRKKLSKKKRQGKGKGKKCIFKVIKNNKMKNRRGGIKTPKKKYMMPLILGLLAAKSLLIPIALKALAFMSAKAFMMGFFSTVLASVLSLKGLFDHGHGYVNRKEDTKTQVEIIQVPSKSEDHVHYDEHYKKGDLVPILVNEGGSFI